MNKKILRSGLIAMLMVGIILFTGCGPNYQFNKARKLENRGEYKLALQKYQMITDRFPSKPQSIEAQFRIGEIYRNQYQDYESALKAYQIIVTGKPQTDWAKKASKQISECKNIMIKIKENLDLGNKYFQQKTFIETMKSCQEVLKYQPNNTQANELFEEAKRMQTDILLKRGNQYFNKNHYSSAIKTYKEILIFDPENETALSKISKAETARKYTIASGKSFNCKEGFIAYYATSGGTIDKGICEKYIGSYYPEIYRKQRSNEFAWRESLSKIKGELNERIKGYDISTNYWTQLPMPSRGGFGRTRMLGEYDFKAKGFPLDISYSIFKMYFISLQSGGSGEIGVRVYPENLSDFNFLPYSEAAAKKFIQRKKNRYGTVDRRVTIVVHFTLLPVKSKESQAVLHDTETSPYFYNLVAKINKVEVYEDKGRTRKMGLLTKK